MNSFNHYAFGAIGDWMYRTIGGLDVDDAAPGYRHAIIAPKPGGGLTSAKTELQTPYGILSSEWKLVEGRMQLAIVVPSNTWATVTLPHASADHVSESGRPLHGTDGIRGIRQSGTDLIVELGSGPYLFAVSGGQ